jgi:hypothetical protein
MTSIFRLSKPLAVGIAFLMTLTLVTGGAVAQQATTTEEPDPIKGTVGPIEIQDYRVENGQMVLEINAERPTPIALSDSLAGLEGGGVTQIPLKQQVIPAGEQELRLDVTVRDGTAAVTLSTRTDAARIQTGTITTSRPSVPWGTVTGLIALTFGATAYVTYRGVRKKYEENDEPEVSRFA